MPDTIGSLAVDIIGNLAPLADDLAKAQTMAAAGAQSIAGAFNQASSTVSSLAESFRTGKLAGVEFETAMKAAYAEGYKLSDVMAEVNRQTAAAVSSTSAASPSFRQLAEQMGFAVDASGRLRDSMGRFATDGEAAKSILDQLREAHSRGAMSADELAKKELELANAMKAAGEATKEASTNIQGVGQAMTQIGSNLTQIGTVLTAGLTVPIIGVGAAAVTMAAKFETAMTEVRSISDLMSASAFAGLEKKVIDLSNRMGVDAVDAAHALYQAISTGVPENNTLSFIETATQLAIAGLGKTETAMDGMISVMNQFNIPWERASYVADVLFKTVRDGKGRLDEVASSIGKAGGQAHEMGVSLEQLTAAAATLSLGPAKNMNVAFTELSSIMNSLLKPNKAMNELIAETGFATGKALIEAKGFQGALVTIRDAAGGMTDELGKALGRTEAIRGVIGLTGENAAKAAKELESMGKSAGAMTTAFAQVDQSTERVFAHLIVQAKNVAIELGTALLPLAGNVLEAMKPAVAAIEGIVHAFVALPQPIQTAITGVALFAAALGPVTLVIGGIVSGFGRLITAAVEIAPYLAAIPGAIVGMGEAFVAAGAAVMAFAVESLPAAIAAIGRFSTALLVGAAQAISEFALVTLPAAGAAMLTFASTAIPAAIAGMETLIAVTIPGLIASFSTLATTGLASAGSALVGFASNAVAMAGSALSSLAAGAIPIAVGALSTLAVGVTLAAGAFAGFKLGEWLYNNVPAFKAFGDAVGGAINRIHDWLASWKIVNDVLAAIGDPVAKANQAMVAASESAGRLAAKLAEHGVVIERGTMSMDQYVAALMRGVSSLGSQASAADVAASRTTAHKIAVDSANESLRTAESYLASVVKAYNAGSASAADVAKAQEAVAAAQGKVAAATGPVTTGFHAMASGAKSAGDESAKLADQQEKVYEALAKASSVLLNQTKDSYSEYVATLDAGGKKAATILSELAAEINKAETALPGLSGVAAEETRRLIETLKSAQTAMKEFADTDALQTMAAKVAEIAAKFPRQVQEMTGAAGEFLHTMLAIADQVPAALNKVSFTDLISKLLEAQKQLDDQQDKWNASVEKGAAATLKLGGGFAAASSAGHTFVTQVDVIPGLFDRIASGGNKALADIMDALKSTGIAWDGNRQSIEQLLPAIDKVFTSQLTNLPRVEAEWQKYGAQIKEAAARGVPEAIKAWEDYIAVIGRLNGPLAEAVERQHQLRDAIEEGAAAGVKVGDLVFEYEKLKIKLQDVGDRSRQMSQGQIIDLANIREAVLANRDATNLLSDTYVSALNIANKGFEEMGKRMADNLLAGENLFKGLGQMVQALGKQILEEFVGKAMKALGESLVTVFTDGAKSLLGLKSGVEDVSKAIHDMVGKAASSQVDSLAGGIGAPAPSGGGAAAGAGSEAAGSGLLGAVGAISAAVGAVSSVIGNFQMAGINKSLDLIVNHTLRIFNVVDQWHTQWFDREGMVFDRLGEIWGAIFDGIEGLARILTSGMNNLFDRLGDIWKTLQQIGDGQSIQTQAEAAMLDQVAAVTGGTAVSGVSTPDPGRSTAAVTAASAASAIGANLQLIAQVMQGFAGSQDDVARNVQSLATQEASVASAIRTLVGNQSPIAPALVDAAANSAVVVSSLNNVVAGTDGMAQALSELAGVTGAGVTAASTAQVATNAALQGINDQARQSLPPSMSTATNTGQAVAHLTGLGQSSQAMMAQDGAWQSASLAGNGQLVAAAGLANEMAAQTSDQVAGVAITGRGVLKGTQDIFTSTNLLGATARNMEVVARSTDESAAKIADSTASTSDNTAATVANTADISKQIQALGDQLAKSNADMFGRLGDVISATGHLDDTVVKGFTGLYSDNKIMYATFKEMLDELKAIDANTAKIIISTTHTGAATVTVPPLGSTIPPLGTVIPPIVPPAPSLSPTVFAASAVAAASNAVRETPSANVSAPVTMGNITINVNGAAGPDQTVRAIHRYMRNLSPSFAASSTSTPGS